MGIQFIFCVETNKQCKSDQIYIKDTIERFFTYDNAMVRFSFVYMDGKYKYSSKSVKSQISKMTKEYAGTNNNQSVVIYCFDCDDYDCNQRDSKFLAEVEEYCKDNNYEHIWFCKDVERVYIGEKVPDKLKKQRAADFRSKKRINSVRKEMLQVDQYRQNCSNILNVLSKYECMKWR